MSEKPILYSGEMVRAILDGRKTQTRRVIKNPPWLKMDDKSFYAGIALGVSEGMEFENCPYGRPGDRLWVREAWRPGAWRDDGRIAIDYKASPELTNTPWVTIPDDFDGKTFDDLWLEWTDELLNAGSIPDDEGYHHWEAGRSPLRWRPSIFMPRWASRITLQVTAVRVERVQDISEEDAIAEGLDREWCSEFVPETGMDVSGFDYRDYSDPSGITWTSPLESFKTLWDSINAKRGYSWDSNPWVWVVEFEQVKS